ncbi:aminotransferase class III-fold pyridoxal phosphate-dependent enzyme, partial [Chromobacterium haemolyticum]
KVAAFVGEPIQGAGGVIIPPATYWPEVERICRKYDVLLVADEVICGFGRTGEWFGFEHFGFRPDIFTTAKGLSSGYLPIGAVFVGERVA